MLRIRLRHRGLTKRKKAKHSINNLVLYNETSAWHSVRIGFTSVLMVSLTTTYSIKSLNDPGKNVGYVLLLYLQPVKGKTECGNNERYK